VGFLKRDTQSTNALYYCHHYYLPSIALYFYFSGSTGVSSGLCAWLAGVLILEQYLQPFFA
jgi:hypothetical protein